MLIPLFYLDNPTLENCLMNCLFINRPFNKNLPTIFKNCFPFLFGFYAYNTCWSNCEIIWKKLSAIYTWNYLQNLNENNLFF